MTATVTHACINPATAAAIPTQRAVASAPQPRAAADLTLAATPTAVNVGLMFLDLTLSKWGHLELRSIGTPLLAELVGQAVSLTGVSDPSTRWLDLNDLALINVRLLLFDHGIVIEVADRHREPPTPSDAFRSLSRRWHFSATPAGRVVWCEVALAPYELTEHGLPKRKRSARSPTQRAPDPPVDSDVLQRVLDGLNRF